MKVISSTPYHDAKRLIDVTYATYATPDNIYKFSINSIKDPTAPSKLSRLLPRAS